jgi:hypothetical protein
MNNEAFFTADSNTVIWIEIDTDGGVSVDGWMGIGVRVSVCGDGRDRGLRGTPAVITTAFTEKRVMSATVRQ